jgi:hypothetical protein
MPSSWMTDPLQAAAKKTEKQAAICTLFVVLMDTWVDDGQHTQF